MWNKGKTTWTKLTVDDRLRELEGKVSELERMTTMYAGGGLSHFSLVKVRDVVYAIVDHLGMKISHKVHRESVALEPKEDVKDKT